MTASTIVFDADTVHSQKDGFVSYIFFIHRDTGRGDITVVHFDPTGKPVMAENRLSVTYEVACTAVRGAF